MEVPGDLVDRRDDVLDVRITRLAEGSRNAYDDGIRGLYRRKIGRCLEAFLPNQGAQVRVLDVLDMRSARADA